MIQNSYLIESNLVSKVQPLRVLYKNQVKEPVYKFAPSDFHVIVRKLILLFTDYLQDEYHPVVTRVIAHPHFPKMRFIRIRSQDTGIFVCEDVLIS